MIVFDMNTRERKRFALQLETLRSALGEAIDALQQEDDQRFAGAMTAFALMGPSILQDMQPVFEAAQAVDLSDLDDPNNAKEE